MVWRKTVQGVSLSRQIMFFFSFFNYLSFMQMLVHSFHRKKCHRNINYSVSAVIKVFPPSRRSTLNLARCTLQSAYHIKRQMVVIPLSSNIKKTNYKIYLRKQKKMPQVPLVCGQVSKCLNTNRFIM